MTRATFDLRSIATDQTARRSRRLGRDLPLFMTSPMMPTRLKEKGKDISLRLGKLLGKN